MRRIWKRLVPATALGAALAFAAGCGDDGSQTRDTKPAAVEKDGAEKGHDHPSEGPHKGALAEWGEEEYHAEFTVDHDAKEAAVYVLDESAKKAKPIEAKTLTLTLKLQPPVTVTLTASPQEGDPAGQSSRFVGKHEALGKVQEFAGTISGAVGGKPYSGDFEEHPHGPGDHKH